jgi:phosphatidate cytidylyltransferase
MGRNLGVAVAVGLGAAVVAIGALAVGSWAAVLLVVVALVVAIGEYQAAAQRAGYHPASLLGLVAAASYPLAVYWKGIEAYPLLIVLTLGAALAWHLVGADGDARVVESVGVTLFGVAWVAGLGSFAALLLAQADGRGMFATAVIAAVGYDVGGLFIGRTVGSRPVSDASPNKTMEGLFGGMLVSLAAVFIVTGLFGLAPWGDPGDALKIGLLAMLAAPLGDLCESLVKRDLGVKDMGNLLPEHGGLLDRFDGLLFVLPAVFYAAMLFDLAPF